MIMNKNAEPLSRRGMFSPTSLRLSVSIKKEFSVCLYSYQYLQGDISRCFKTIQPIQVYVETDSRAEVRLLIHQRFRSK